MANVTVTSTLSNVAVNTNLSNITVSEGNVLVANITTSQTNVTVGTTTTNVTVSPIAAVSNAEVRAAIGIANIGGYGFLSYDNTVSSNGIIQYQGVTASEITDQARLSFSNVSPILYNSSTGQISIDEAALFSGKTTDDLSEGSTNLYYTNARVNAYIIDAGLDFNAEKVDDRVANLLQTSGNLTFTYNDVANTLTLSQSLTTTDITEGNNLYYTTTRANTNIKNFLSTEYGITETGSPGTGVITVNNEINVPIIEADIYAQDYYNHGNVSGLVNINLLNGSLHKLRAIGDIQLNIIDTVIGSSLSCRRNSEVSIILEQDEFGQHEYNLGNVYYVNGTYTTATYINNNTTPAYDANSRTLVSYIIVGGNEASADRKIYGAVTYLGTQPLEIDITGNITTTGNIIGAYLYGDGSNITNLPSSLTNAQVIAYIAANDLTVGGNLEVTGNINYVNTQDLQVLDNTITLNYGNATSRDGFIYVDRSGSSLNNVAVKWNNTANAWQFTNDGSTYYNIPIVTSTTANVESVNGQTGVVVLDTGDIAENGNLYFTTDRANTAIDNRVTAGFVNALSIDYNSLANTPSLANVATSGDYNDLINTPVLANVATSGDYNDLINTPALANVATSGDYNDLINTPANVSDFNNDSGYLVSANLASLTANVDSVNGATGVVVLDTDDISEGSANLYFTTDRANTAIDNRVDVAYVNALGVDYNSLANTPSLANVATSGDYNDLINTPTNVSVFANDAGYLVAANLASLTANVDSVNGQTGVVVLDTGDIAENGNLYFTTDRTNTAIDAYVVGSENILVNSGVISTPNALGNINSVTSEGGTRIQFDSDSRAYTLTKPLGANNVDTPLTTVRGGWGWLQTSQLTFIQGITSGLTVTARVLDYTGSANVESLMFTGNAISGSNVIQLTGMETYRTVASSDTTIPISSIAISGSGNIATLINEIVPGMALLGGSVNQIGSAGTFFNSSNPHTVGRAYPFPTGSYITDIDTGNLTVTMSSPALADFEFTSTATTGSAGGYNSGFFHAGVDPNTGFMIVFQSLYDMINTGAGSKTALGPYLKIPSYNIYAYPVTGPVAGDFNFSVGSPSDYVLDWTINPTPDYPARFVGRASYGAADEVITYNFQDGVSVGASAQMSTSGAPFDRASWGIKQFYDGLEDYSDFYNLDLTFQGPNITTFKPGVALTNFTDKTFAHARPSTGGPEFTFAVADGNLNDPETEWYVKNTTELGRISWTGYSTATNLTPQQSAQIPFYNPGAFISVTAGSDYVKLGQPSKTNFHIAATSEPIGLGTNPSYTSVKDLFLSYDNGGLYLGAGRPNDAGRQSITFGPAAELSYFTTVGGSGSGPNNHWTSGTKRSWVEITSANITADTGSRLTVTNGGTNGGNTTVGDMVIELNRVANTRDRLQEGTIAQLASGTSIRNGNGGGTTRFPDADTVGFFVVNTSTLTPLANGTQVYFTGSAEYVGADLIEWSSNVSNTAYVCLGRSTGVEGTIGATRYYGVFKDSGFTTPLTWAEISGDTFANIFGAGGQTPIYQGLIVEYDSTAAHTAKSWSFELTEASDNLELKEDGTTVVTFDGGTVTATAFIGDGSSLTNSLVNYTTDDLTEGNTNVYFTTDRANTAIDNRVDVAFVDALGVDYNSLANVPSFANVATTGDYNDLINTPANVSDFANDAGYLVAANLASLTANVDSVNGFTGVVSLDTDDVPEGSANLYFSNARVNAFIQDSITTTDIDEGTNLYWTTDRGNSMVEAFQGNINTVGTITATSFTGDGSDLTGVRAETITEKVKNVSGGTLAKGTPVYATGGVVADVLEVAACDAGDPAKMPCIGVLSTALDDDEEGTAILAGRISGVDTSAFVPGDQLYVAIGGGYANTSPAGESNVVQFLGTVTRVDATVGGGIVHVSEPRDTDALNSGNIFIGSGANRTITATLNTSIVPESGNLYFTTDRANTAIGAYTGNIAPANVSLTKFNETVVSLGNISGDISGNLNVTNGTIFTLTTNGNITANTLTNAVAGTSATLIITNGGSHTLSSTMKFAGGSKTLSTAANAVDIISVFYDGTTYYATLSKGYV